MTQQSLLPIELPMSGISITIGNQFHVLGPSTMFPRDFSIHAIACHDVTIHTATEVFQTTLSRIDLYLENRWIEKIS